MSFWLHQHPAVRTLSSIAPFYCYGVAVLVSLLSVAAMCFYLIFPMRQCMQSIEQQVASLEKQVAAFEAVLDHHQALTTEHEQLVARKQDFASDIATLQDTLNDLLMIMRDHKISCRGIVPLGGKVDGLHEKHIVSVKAKGSFAKIIVLLKAFEQPQYPITMRSVKLVKARGNMVLLDVTMQVISVKES